jgi:hypothetical protein
MFDIVLGPTEFMKKNLFAILILFASQIWAQSVNGFANINFGLDRQHVIEEIMKLGYDPLEQTESGDRVVIPVYMMDDLPVQVDFLFNKNDKFFAFEVRTGRMEADRLPKVFEALDYMSEQFTLKYGSKYKITLLQEADIKPGVHNLYRQWIAHKALNIYTAIILKDGRYYSVGSVTNRNLAKEDKISKSNASRKENKAPSF